MLMALHEICFGSSPDFFYYYFLINQKKTNDK